MSATLLDDIERDALAGLQQAPAAPLVGPPHLLDSPESAQPAIQSLEDLYGAYPLGDGVHILRIERMEPSYHNGVRIAGFLEDSWNRISMQEFSAKFGGGLYHVHVMKYMPSPSGNHELRTRKTIKVRVPGVPVPVRPMAGSDTPANGGGNGGGDNMSVTHMLDAVRAAAADHRPQVDFLRAAEQMASSRTEQVRTTLQDQVSSLRQEYAALRAEKSKLEDRIREIESEKLEIQRDADKRIAMDEHRRVQEVKALHEVEIRRLTEKHEDEIRRLEVDRNRALDDARRRYDDTLQERLRVQESDKRALEERAASESARALNTYQTQLTNLTTQFESRLAEATRTNESRLKDLERSHAQALTLLQTTHASQLESIRTLESSKASNAETSAKMQVDMMARQIADLRGDLSRLQAENESLKARVYKDPIEALTQAQQLVAMTGGGPREGGEEGGGEMDWKKMVVEVAKGAVPGIFQVMSQAASRGAAPAVQPQQQHAPALPPGPVAAVDNRQWQVQPPAPQQRRRPGVAPWGAFSAGSQPRAAAPLNLHDAPQAVAPSVAEVAIPQQQAPQQVVPMPPPPPVVPMQQQAPPPPPAQATPAGGGGDVFGAVSEQQFVQFLSELDNVIKTGSTPPQDFARGFIQAVGAGTARQVVSAVSADQLVGFVSSMPTGQSAAIVTRAGRQYLSALWQEVDQQTRGAA